jgi:uncharacterized protein
MKDIVVIRDATVPLTTRSDTGPTRRLTTVSAMPSLSGSPTPFRQYVLKIQSRCNLACNYCYVYNMADQSWRSKPAIMAREVITKTAVRIAQAAERHRLSEVFVTLHGGEPLLAGRELIEFALDTMRDCIPAEVTISFSIQTNGTLLDRNFLETMLKHRVSVGISLDGNRAANDRHRNYTNGRSSYSKVIRSLELLQSEPFRDIYAGILCVIDIEANPTETYDSLLAFNPPVIDFLLPQGNWTHRPPGRMLNCTSTPYADWLIEIFDRWWGASPVSQSRIRFFEEIIQLCLGGHSRCETIGLSPIGVIIVDTDGSLEQVDTLKSTYHGAPATGLNVFSANFDSALVHPSVIARQIGIEALSDTCQACPIHRVCGGGYYPHRYDSMSGFRNPSVYCPDLAKIIGHIHGRTAKALSQIFKSSS